VRSTNAFSGKSRRGTSKCETFAPAWISLISNRFNTFFTHLDNYRDPTFLYLTSGGLEATKKKLDSKAMQANWEDSEDENASGGEG
jgi:hypothetical protein